jgi:TM2 domain-containing membrane protein YozV
MSESNPLFRRLPPHCTPGSKSKGMAGLLAILLGAFGVHHFYLGAWGTGLIYLLVILPISAATGFLLSGIICLADAIRLWTLDDERFSLKYCCGPVQALEFPY